MKAGDIVRVFLPSGEAYARVIKPRGGRVQIDVCGAAMTVTVGSVLEKIAPAPQ